MVGVGESSRGVLWAPTFSSSSVCASDIPASWRAWRHLSGTSGKMCEDLRICKPLPERPSGKNLGQERSWWLAASNHSWELKGGRVPHAGTRSPHGPRIFLFSAPLRSVWCLQHLREWERVRWQTCIPSFFAEFIVCKAYCAQLVTDLGSFLPALEISSSLMLWPYVTGCACRSLIA